MGLEPMSNLWSGIPTGVGSFCAGDIRLWDSETGECLRTYTGHTGTIRSVAWGQDERYIVSASHDRSMRIWDFETADCIQVLKGHDECIVNAAWDLDRKSVLSCDSSGGLGAWAIDSASVR